MFSRAGTARQTPIRARSSDTQPPGQPTGDPARPARFGRDKDRSALTTGGAEPSRTEPSRAAPSSKCLCLCLSGGGGGTRQTVTHSCDVSRTVRQHSAVAGSAAAAAAAAAAVMVAGTCPVSRRQRRRAWSRIAPSLQQYSSPTQDVDRLTGADLHYLPGRTDRPPSTTWHHEPCYLLGMPRYDPTQHGNKARHGLASSKIQQQSGSNSC